MHTKKVKQLGLALNQREEQFIYNSNWTSISNTFYASLLISQLWCEGGNGDFLGFSDRFQVSFVSVR